AQPAAAGQAADPAQRDGRALPGDRLPARGRIRRRLPGRRPEPSPVSVAKPRFGRSLKPFRRPLLWSALWTLAVAVVVVASLVPVQGLPEVPRNFDKVEHFAAYAALAAGAVQLFARRLSWGFVCVLLVLIGIGLEHLQAQMAFG